MSRRLLLLDGPTVPSEPIVAALSQAAEGIFQLDHATWASVRQDNLADHSADLFVPVVLTQSSDAFDFLEWLSIHPLSKPTLAVVPDGAGDDLLRSAAQAADDFILLPAHRSELSQRIARILGPERQDEDVVHTKLVERLGLAQLVGRDPGFVRTVDRIPTAARSGSPVLITGETGTGKELCARAIHQLGPRRSLPFIPVDCGALPDHLIENELFGHARGAFTDARADQKGLVAMAHGGTLFLDEVDALSLPAQAKLLRFLQDRSYKPLGSDHFVQADVTVLAATNQDPERLVAQQRLRADLFFRLNVLRLRLPPLRERRGDISLLARHFADSLCAEGGLGRKTLTPAAIRKLTEHNWPGNARELFNVIQRAVLFTEDSRVMPAHALDLGSPRETSGDEASEGFRQARSRALASFEKLYVEDLLRKHTGNVTRAAKEAQKDRRAFGRLVKKYSIRRLDF